MEKILGGQGEEKEGTPKEGSSGSSGENEANQTGENKQEVTITKMEQELVLNENQEVDWKLIQGGTELLYSVWPTIVLDLNNMNVDSNKIVEFSNTLDETLSSIEQKDKAKTSENLAKLYGFLPEFLQDINDIEDVKKEILKTKSYLLKAYAAMDAGNIQSVTTETANTKNCFMQIVNNISKENDQRKFNINKAYILIEELKNSLSQEKSQIFYLKYKNIVEELNTLM